MRNVRSTVGGAATCAAETAYPERSLSPQHRRIEPAAVASRDRGEPLEMFAILAGHCILEGALQAFGDRAR